jgi:hypothetical protein
VSRVMRAVRGMLRGGQPPCVVRARHRQIVTWALILGIPTSAGLTCAGLSTAGSLVALALIAAVWRMP